MPPLQVNLVPVLCWELFWVQNSWDQGIFEGNRLFLRFYIINIHYAEWIANLLSILMQKQGNNEWTVLDSQFFPCSIQHQQAPFSQQQDLCFHTQYPKAEIWFCMIKCFLFNKFLNREGVNHKVIITARWAETRSRVDESSIFLLLKKLQCPVGMKNRGTRCFDVEREASWCCWRK